MKIRRRSGRDVIQLWVQICRHKNKRLPPAVSRLQPRRTHKFADQDRNIKPQPTLPNGPPGLATFPQAANDNIQ